ncbi:MAG TPA: hemerythrin domain-containing protein [Blastocatellia bacterium]|nr:hemerythrin domain-containing protein [Blastocatellia bacterium]
MSRPTHLLKREHRVIEQAMRALEGMCFRIRTGGAPPSEEISKLLDFIRNYADRHHHAKESSHLFPALEQIGILDGKGPLAFLREEHETERRLLGDLESAVEEYRHDPAAGAEFVSAANQYKDHLIERMQQEEAILFRLAEEMLDDRVKDALTRLFADENAETQERTRHYEQLAKELEKDWTV